MYSKPDQKQFLQAAPASEKAEAVDGLEPGEFVVQLDTGEFVAVIAQTFIVEESGNPSIHARARVVNADGSAARDANGDQIQTGFSHSTNQVELENLGGITEVQRAVLLAVLGEPASQLWADPVHASVLEHASIRTNIASAAHSGVVPDVGQLL
jgi:hypothetical protein